MAGKISKLAAVTATSGMNAHYHHPYPEMNSPHSPATDGIPGGYRGNLAGGPTPNGHIIGGHHDHHHPAFTGVSQHPVGAHAMHNHHHHHHDHNTIMLNNSNNNTSNNNQNCTNVKICGGCGLKIVEKYLLHALDQYWHDRCLKCCMCGALLANVGSSCFTKENMILCKSDYIRLFGNTGACSSCGQTIAANELVMRVGGSGLPGGGNMRTHHVFHVQCFACSKCNAVLRRGDRYYLLAGSLVCEQDWHKLLKNSANAGPQQNSGATVRKGKVGRPRRSRD